MYQGPCIYLTRLFFHKIDNWSMWWKKQLKKWESFINKEAIVFAQLIYEGVGFIFMDVILSEIVKAGPQFNLLLSW